MGRFSLTLFTKRLRGQKMSVAPTVSVRVLVVLLVIATGLGVVVGVYGGAYFFRRGIPVTVSKVPAINRLLERVRTHIIINTSEDPTVATVENAETLRQQNPVFYKDVQAGDKLIVWTDRAVLYSPKRDLVLAAIVAPDIRAATGGGTAAAPDVKSLTVEVRNGTGTPGATKWLTDRLKESGYAVTATKSTKKVYKSTLTIRGSAKAANVPLDTFVSLAGGALGDLPADEAPTTADLLVILGTDQR